MFKIRCLQIILCVVLTGIFVSGCSAEPVDEAPLQMPFKENTWVRKETLTRSSADISETSYETLPALPVDGSLAKKLKTISTSSPEVKNEQDCLDQASALDKRRTDVQKRGGVWHIFESVKEIREYTNYGMQLDSQINRLVHSLKHLCRATKGMPLNGWGREKVEQLQKLGKEKMRQKYLALGDAKGDIDLWIKTAYALKARYALNIATKDESIAYTEVLGYIGNAFTSNDDDYEIAYEANISGANANPLYQFMNDRTDIRMSSTFVNTLSDDPRLPFYVAVDLSGEYSGSIPGSENSAASKLGDYSAGVGALTYFSTYSEMKFLEAECKYRLGMIDEAATTFHEAVEASLMKVTNVADSTFMADNVYNINSASINLQKIIEQKYIAMYATVVSYDDWRRTGFPELAPVAGATKATPVRFPYPQSEITYNSNCPVGVQLSEILWIFE